MKPYGSVRYEQFSCPYGCCTHKIYWKGRRCRKIGDRKRKKRERQFARKLLTNREDDV